MKKYFTLPLFSLLLLSCSINAIGQDYCNDDVFLSLSPWDNGQTQLVGDMFLEGSLNYEDVSLSVNSVDCSDIGVVEVEITATLNGVPIMCESKLHVEDKTPPVAIVEAEAIVQLGASGTYNFAPDEFDNGSFDNCTDDLLYETTPSSVNASDVGNAILVTMRVTDEYGNFNQTYTLVTVVGGTPSPLACIESVTVQMPVLNPLQLYPSSFLAAGDGDLVLSIYDLDDVLISDQGILPVGLNGTFRYEVVDLNTGNTCWGNLLVEGNPNYCNTLVCNLDVNVSMGVDASGNTSVDITPDMLLEGNYDFCFDKYTVVSGLSVGDEFSSVFQNDEFIEGHYGNDIDLGVYIVVVDPETKQPLVCPEGGAFGADTPDGWRDRFAWPFDTFNEENRSEIIDFLNNQVPEGHYVFMMTVSGPGASFQTQEWEEELTGFFENEGAKHIRLTQEKSVPYIFAYRKGMGRLAEKIGNAETDYITQDIFLDYFNITITDASGNEQTGNSMVSISEEGTYNYQVSQSVAPFNSCWGNFTVGTTELCHDSLVCKGDILLQFPDGAEFVTIFPEDLLNEFDEDCDYSEFHIQITNLATGVIISNLGSVSTEVAGDYTYVVSNPTNDNSCWGNLTIEIGLPCPDVEITYPTDVIELSVVGLNESNIFEEMSPDNLISNYGLTESEVRPQYVDIDNCHLFGVAYEDLLLYIVESNNSSFKIIRTWTLIDWYTSEIYTYTQIIKNVVDMDNICDFLPNSAPFGDCDSGHTDTDDVEWPDDLKISDYRITPSELQAFSFIDANDTKPEFFSSTVSYTAEYIDYLGEFSEEEIVINRVWDVYKSGYTLPTATYLQTITVDISGFSSLVSVNTMGMRPVPGVNLNDLDFTNEFGIAYVQNDDPLSPSFEDTPYNGINIKDFILLFHSIINLTELSDQQRLAADVNLNSMVSATDIIELRKTLLGVSTLFNHEWRFFENFGSSIESLASIEPKESFLAIKPGDIDDSATLTEPIEYPKGHLVVSDFLINKGESYETTLNYDGEDLSFGVEIHLSYDDSLIEINDVILDNEDIELAYHINEPGELNIVILQTNGVGFLFNNENLVTLEFTALENGLLSQAINSNSERASYLLGLDYELIELTTNLEDVIDTSVNDISDAKQICNVYPNPAHDVLNFDFYNPQDLRNSQIEIYNTQGQLLINADQRSQLDVSSLTPGFYIYRIEVNSTSYTGKLNMVD